MRTHKKATLSLAARSYQDFVSWEEPFHLEPAFWWVRNGPYPHYPKRTCCNTRRAADADLATQKRR